MTAGAMPSGSEGNGSREATGRGQRELIIRAPSYSVPPTFPACAVRSEPQPTEDCTYCLRSYFRLLCSYAASACYYVTYISFCFLWSFLFCLTYSTGLPPFLTAVVFGGAAGRRSGSVTLRLA